MTDAKAKFHEQSLPGDEIPIPLINYYRLLGLPNFEADLVRIENAYRGQCSAVRKYLNGKRASLATEKLKLLSEANAVLTTPSRKLAYDKSLKARETQHAPLASQPPPKPITSLRRDKPKKNKHADSRTKMTIAAVAGCAAFIMALIVYSFGFHSSVTPQPEASTEIAAIPSSSKQNSGPPPIPAAQPPAAIHPPSPKSSRGTKPEPEIPETKPTNVPDMLPDVDQPLAKRPLEEQPGEETKNEPRSEFSLSSLPDVCELKPPTSNVLPLEIGALSEILPPDLKLRIRHFPTEDSGEPTIDLAPAEIAEHSVAWEIPAGSSKAQSILGASEHGCPAFLFVDGGQLKFSWRHGATNGDFARIQNSILLVSSGTATKAISFRSAQKAQAVVLNLANEATVLSLKFANLPKDDQLVQLEILPSENATFTYEQSPPDEKLVLGKQCAIKLQGWERAELALVFSRSPEGAIVSLRPYYFIGDNRSVWTLANVDKTLARLRINLAEYKEDFATAEMRASNIPGEIEYLRSSPLPDNASRTAAVLWRGTQIDRLSRELKARLATVNRLTDAIPKLEETTQRLERLSEFGHSVNGVLAIRFRVQLLHNELPIVVYDATGAN